MRVLVLSAYMKARTDLVATPSAQLWPTEDGWSFGDELLPILLTCHGGLNQLSCPSHSRKNPWLVSQAGLVSLQDAIRQAPSSTPCAYLKSLQFSKCPFQTRHVGFKVNPHKLQKARGLSKCKPCLTIEAVPPLERFCFLFFPTLYGQAVTSVRYLSAPTLGRQVFNLRP